MNLFLNQLILNNYLLNSPLILSNKNNYNINFFKIKNSFSNFLYLFNNNKFFIFNSIFNNFLNSSIILNNYRNSYNLYLSNISPNTPSIINKCIFYQIIGNHNGAVYFLDSSGSIKLISSSFIKCKTSSSTAGLNIQSCNFCEYKFLCFDDCNSIHFSFV